MKIYYIVSWRRNCWDSFMQHQINIVKSYKIKKEYIRISDYREDPNDAYYCSVSTCNRKDFCFKAEKEEVFTDNIKAEEYALEKIGTMFLSRQQHLLKEYYEALDKIKGFKNDTSKN